MNRVLILTEAGGDIGLGHLSRCSAIKGEIERRGNRVHGQLLNQGLLIAEGWEQVDWINEGNLPDLSAFDAVLIDSYLAPINLYEIIAEKHSNVWVIDDYQRVSYPERIGVVNPNLYGDELDYGANEAVGGKDYVILRDSFRFSDDKAVIDHNINEVTITVGGTDLRQLIPRLMHVTHGYFSKVNVLCGSEDKRDKIGQLTIASDFELHAGLSEAEMKKLMLRTDLCITACGQTLHELSYLGVPSIGIVIDTDQEQNAKKYNELGILTDYNRWDDPNLEGNLRDQLGQWADVALRMEVSHIGRTLIDGQGVNRIVDFLLSNGE